MRASLFVYEAAKEGSSAAEYEDAWYALPGVADELPGDWVAVAVADGATESLLARKWARMMVEEFAVARTSASDARSFAETALGLSARWPAVVDAYTAERERAARPLRWYERPGIEKGAFATLLTLQMNATTSAGVDTSGSTTAGEPGLIGDWAAAAMGDTCLFQVRDGRLHQAFPLSESTSFGTSPALLGSSDTDLGTIASHVRLTAGTIAEGDDFFVCTDAMAAWFLARCEEGGSPWETLRDLNDLDFARWLTGARRTNGLHNDDVTIVHIDIW